MVKFTITSEQAPQNTINALYRGVWGNKKIKRIDMAIGMTKVRQLDPKICWKIIGHDGVSCYKAPFVLMNEYGQYNLNTGKPFSHQGVWESANAYLLENMAEARKDTEDVWKANGRLLSDADWYKIVIEKARYLSPKKYKAFMEKHQYLTPYLTQ